MPSVRPHSPVTNLTVEFPESGSRLDQDQEWCLVTRDGFTERVRFHDYARIYEIPGLYEKLFYERLACTSPTMVASLLKDAVLAEGEVPPSLAVLDLGAGNGMVGEALLEIGAHSFVGVDVVREAREACQRDRPGLYRDYVVADFTDLPAATAARISGQRLNTLTTVAALGFGDIPAAAFRTAWNLIETPGWVAFNIKETFLDEKYQHGFALLIRRLVEAGLLDVRTQQRYLHRLAMSGEPLYYIAIVGRKTGQIPSDWRIDERA